MSKECKHPTCGPKCRREKPTTGKPWSQYNRRKAQLGNAETNPKDLDLSDMIAIAQAQFNLYIRLRDQHMGCISCETGRVEHAGHYFPAGKFSSVRFDDVNVNGQCRFCNVEQQGNLEGYHHGMITRYGADAVKELELRAQACKLYKWDKEQLRDLIIEIKSRIQAINQKPNK